MTVRKFNALESASGNPDHESFIPYILYTRLAQSEVPACHPVQSKGPGQETVSSRAPDFASVRLGAFLRRLRRGRPCP